MKIEFRHWEEIMERNGVKILKYELRQKQQSGNLGVMVDCYGFESV